MSAVDWDLLAEHLGGALAGTPEGDRVAGLVATDPAWAEAAAELSVALDAVAADLRTVDPAPPMPAQIAARLEAALRAGAATAPPDSLPVRPAPRQSVRTRPSGGTRQGGGRPPGRPDPGRSGPTRSGPDRVRRGRRTRWAGALAGLAGVAAFAAIGLGPLGLLDAGGDDSGATAPVAEADAPDLADGQAAPDVQAAPEAAAGLPVMTVSDLDYQPGATGLRTPGSGEVMPGQPPREPASADQESAADRPGPPLAQLWDDPAPCLAAVRAGHTPAPVTVTQMDFARFEGEPAVIVWLTTGDGDAWVQVVGPGCGGPEAAADERHREVLE